MKRKGKFGERKIQENWAVRREPRSPAMAGAGRRVSLESSTHEGSQRKLMEVELALPPPVSV